MNRTNKQRLMDKDYRLMVTRRQGMAEEGEGRQDKRVQIQGDSKRVKWEKGIKYMVAEGNWTLGGKHTTDKHVKL